MVYEWDRNKGLHKALEYDIPPDMVNALIAWVEYGRTSNPNRFLKTVICNNLTEACLDADDINLYRIRSKCGHWLYNWAPSACWGSLEAFETWNGMKKRHKIRSLEDIRRDKRRLLEDFLKCGMDGQAYVDHVRAIESGKSDINISATITIGIDAKKLEDTEWFLYEEGAVKESFLHSAGEDLERARSDFEDRLSSFLLDFIATNKHIKTYSKIMSIDVKTNYDEDLA